MSLFLGVDGGGTKTTVVVLDEAEKQLAVTTGGSTNRNSIGVDVAKQNLFTVIKDALASVGADALGRVKSICLGMSGVDRPDDIALVTSWMTEILPKAKSLVFNDAVAALASGTHGDLEGLVIIAGTGMICWGRTNHPHPPAAPAPSASSSSTSSSASAPAPAAPLFEIYRAGGWGPMLGDAGCGFWLANEALKHAAKAADGRGPSTLLLQTIMTHCSLTHPPELIPWVYKDVAWGRIATLAPCVFECAEKADPIAKSLLDEGAKELAITVATVARKLHFSAEPKTEVKVDPKQKKDAAKEKASAVAPPAYPPVPLVFAGGLLQNIPKYADMVKAEVLKLVPNARIVVPTVSSAIGAAYIALVDSKTPIPH